MLLKQKTIKDINVKNKKVLLRVDFNVPIKNNVITDDNRIVAALPTINYLIDQDAKVILFSHLGRVESEEDKQSASLFPVAKALEKLLGKKVIFIDQTRGSKLESAIDDMNFGDVLLFENTRFEDVPGKKESKNDPELGKYWASLGDVFVNDAFGTAHRAHASNVGIAKNISESCVGFLIQKELEMLSQGIDNPTKPLVAILGGAKVSDKIAVIENLIPKSDQILIGGAMAYTFLKAQGINIGSSRVETDKLELATELLKKANGKIVLPIDHAVTAKFEDVKPNYTLDANIPDGSMGLDIGPKTMEKYANILKTAKTVVWNGPMGVFEFKNFAKGTISVCESIANLTDVFSIIGGGDSASAAINLGYEDDFTHISTGGGASLEYMEGKTLPGIACIQNK
ncbi:MAG: phosphoglycerate kinase [Mycoplasma sp.]